MRHLLLAVMMGIAFAACTEDDPADGGGGSGGTSGTSGSGGSEGGSAGSDAGSGGSDAGSGGSDAGSGGSDAGSGGSDAGMGGEGGSGGSGTCGDGVLDEGEGCDDGNVLDGDGCSSECGVETFYDLVSDFSDVENPFGAWELRAGDIPIPGIVMDWAGITGQTAWANAATGNGHIPSFFKVEVTDSSFEDIVIGDVCLHAQDETNGAGFGPARIVWTSPANGTIDVAGSTWMARDIGRSNDWTLSVAGARVASGSIADGDAYDRANPFDFADGADGGLTDLPVVAEDELVFEVVGAASTPFSDFAGVTLTITLTE